MMHGADLAMWGLMALFLIVPLAALAGAGYLFLRIPRPLATGPVPAVASPTSLRLLDDDERRLYELVAQRAGDVAQGDLVGLSGFSKAKVSRVIDRLERKGLVVRVRRGMGNHVLLAPQTAP